MEVIATKPGYHGKLRAAGDVFAVPEGSKASWFEPTPAELQRQQAEAAAQADAASTDLAPDASKPRAKAGKA